MTGTPNTVDANTTSKKTLPTGCRPHMTVEFIAVTPCALQNEPSEVVRCRHGAAGASSGRQPSKDRVPPTAVRLSLFHTIQTLVFPAKAGTHDKSEVTVSVDCARFCWSFRLSDID